jgi:hypothetical protein
VNPLNGTPEAALRAALADRYTIERELGAGGMATVYLAHDIRHDRKVALKVLRPELSAILGADRFLAEIKTTANLQHPHILPLFDSGEAEGLVFYVMPYVEGESLRDRIVRDKQLPVGEAIRITKEVAGALDYAHRHGLVHRDIKPENILLHDGSAMVADFGIALAVSRSEGGSRLTETGMSLGTPQYMAPEQAMGEREITPKADVYSLGCVLYEMLTGEPPFTGPTAQAIVARVMTERPRSITAQRHTISPHVEAVVWKALEKLPADRFASAAEFAGALERPDSVALPGMRVGLVDRSGKRDWTVTLGVAAGAVAIGIAGTWWWGRSHQSAPPVSRYAIDIAHPGTSVPLFEISRDGSAFVFASMPGNALFVKYRGAADAVPIEGADSAYNPSVSLDGRWVAYNQWPNNRIMKVPVRGGVPVLVADSSLSWGTTWLDDGSIVYVRRSGALTRVPSEGAATTIWLAGKDSVVNLPTALPSSRGVLFVLCDHATEPGSYCHHMQELWVADFAHASTRRLMTGIAQAWYVSPGYLIAVRTTGDAVVVPFDPRRLAVTGDPVPVLDTVGMDDGFSPMMAVTPSGTAVLLTRRINWDQSNYLVWVDRHGEVVPTDSLGVAGRINSIGLAPDGRRVAVDLTTGNTRDIWLHEWGSTVSQRLTFGGHASGGLWRRFPSWTPDGRSVAFVHDSAVGIHRADNTGVEQTVKLDLPISEVAWSPDGKWMLVRPGIEDRHRDILAFRPGIDTAPRPLLADPNYDESAPAISPDGRWIAYESNESGTHEVYVRPFPDVGDGRWQVSSGGGVAPAWSHSGRELFYVRGNEFRVATIAPGPHFAVTTDALLFHLPPDVATQGENHRQYEVAPDDSRFLMISSGSPVGAMHLTVIENWLTEIRARLAAQRATP